MANVDERTTDYPAAVTGNPLVETGEIAAAFGAKGKRVWYSMDRWVVVNETTAIGVAPIEQGQGIPVALVMYQPLSAAALRELRMSDLLDIEGKPMIQGATPPDPDDLRRAWLKHKGARFKTTIRVEEALSRKEGQSADEFYQEVAAVYLRAQAATGKPTAAVAFAGDIPHTTAARWVREARRRGHLPPADRKGE